MQTNEPKERNVAQEDAISPSTSGKQNEDSASTLGTLFYVAGKSGISEKYALLRSVQAGKPDLARELVSYGFSWTTWGTSTSDKTLADRMQELDCFFRCDNDAASEGRVAALGELVQGYAVCPQDLLFNAILHGDERVVDLFKRTNQFALGTLYRQALASSGKNGREEKRDMHDEVYRILEDNLQADTNETVAKKLSWLADVPGTNKLSIFSNKILPTERVNSREFYEFCRTKTDLMECKTQLELAQQAVSTSSADMLDAILHEDPPLSDLDLEYLLEESRDTEDASADITALLLDVANERGILTPDSLALTSEAALEKDWDIDCVTEETCCICGYKGKERMVTIPSAIGQRRVTDLTSNAFNSMEDDLPALYKKRREQITSLEFPGSLRYIPKLNFCKEESKEALPLRRIIINEGTEYVDSLNLEDVSLQQVVLPSSLRHIGAYAFSHGKFTSIELNNGLESIDSGAFLFCENLERVTLPDSLTSLGAYAFEWCNNLKQVRIPEGIAVIPTGLFYNCKNLSDIVLPQSAIRIEDKAFGSCYSLKNIEFSDHLQEIGSHAFEYCTGLAEFVLPDTVEGIGEAAFARCHSLCEITLSSRLTRLGKRAFASCTSLRKIEISDGITSIPAEAFSQCTDLEEVVLPPSVRQIGPRAFADCKRLLSVVFSSRPQFIEQDAFDGCPLLDHLTLPSNVARDPIA